LPLFENRSLKNFSLIFEDLLSLGCKSRWSITHFLKKYLLPGEGAWGKDLLDLFDVINTNQKITDSLKKQDIVIKEKNLVKRMNTIDCDCKMPLGICRWDPWGVFKGNAH